MLALEAHRHVISPYNLGMYFLKSVFPLNVFFGLKITQIQIKATQRRRPSYSKTKEKHRHQAPEVMMDKMVKDGGKRCTAQMLRCCFSKRLTIGHKQIGWAEERRICSGAEGGGGEGRGVRGAYRKYACFPSSFQIFSSISRQIKG